MYQDQTSTPALIFLFILIAAFLAIGGFAVRRSDENKRAKKARSFENTRVRNNPRLNLTDCYVYLIKRERYPGKTYSSTHLKIGIGVENRVREQLREPGTDLIELYSFTIRKEAFEIEQKIIRKWNTKIKGAISTWHTSPGSEFIEFSQKHLEQAREILEDSNGRKLDIRAYIRSKATQSLKDDLLNTKNTTQTSPVEKNLLPQTLERTQVYLLFNASQRFLKIGIGNFNRPDHLKKDTWSISRFCFFESRELARQAEKAVLNFWRNDLNLSIPEGARGAVKSGYTEVVSSIAGIDPTWNIVTKSRGYIPNISENDFAVLDEYNRLIEEGKAIWKVSSTWEKVMKASYNIQKTYLSNDFHLEKSAFENLTSSEERQLRRQMYKYLDRFEDFLQKNAPVLSKIRQMEKWEPQD